MVRWGNRGHLVSIPCVLEVEQFHLLRDLKRDIHFSNPGREGNNRTDLNGREHRTPFSNQFREHAIRSTLFDLSESTEDGEFVVCHTHIRLGNSMSIR